MRKVNIWAGLGENDRPLRLKRFRSSIAPSESRPKPTRSSSASTREVVGRGAYLAVRWAIYNEPERYPFICSEKITGTAEWTGVCVEIHGPPSPDSSSICIALRQDGTGTTLFDDLDVQLLEGA